MPKYENGSYDIGSALAVIEDELIASMIRNMRRHKVEEVREDKQWTMWQTEQLQSLERYKKANKKKYGAQFKDLNGRNEELIRTARLEGEMSQEIAILNAIKKGFPAKKISKGASAEFFKLNDRKLEALIQATHSDMQRAETAVLRMANDRYRKAIFNAQVYANTGAGTYEKAVDMATKDYLSAGLNCIEYANGARHTLSDYADMAIRTASKRAYLQGEGVKRHEWGIHTVIMNKRGNPCPKCLPFCGKVLIDDVWSGGKSFDGSYPMMSTAISLGLYHPRCKDSHTTYFNGISTAPDDSFTKKEIQDIDKQSKKEAKQQYAERQEKRFDRLAKYSLDEKNQQDYRRKRDLWKNARFRTSDMDSREYAASKQIQNSNFRDVTKEWLDSATPNSHIVEELNEYTKEGIIYKVDGKHVIMDYTSKEKQIAQLLENTFGGDIKMVPRVNNPLGVSTPDYLYDGKAYDLKCISGNSKNTLYNAVSKKKKQSPNFIFDITESRLTEAEILDQIGRLYTSKHTTWIEEIIVVKKGKVKNVIVKKK